MKRIITIIATMVAFILLSAPAGAAKFRVNNSGVDADFLQPQNAHDAASDGDTLYIESSLVPYDYLYLSKRLVVIGTGYLLSENDSTQANLADCVIYTITFYAGSANSILTGVTVSSYLTIDDDNILIKRVRSMSGTLVSGDNIVIIQSVLNYVYFGYANVNLQLYNNIVTGEGYTYGLEMGSSNSATIRNNIFKKDQIIYNSVYQNNIFEDAGSFNSYNGIVTNNIGSALQYNAFAGNLHNVNMANVFTYTGSYDGKYKLKAGSPAIGYGSGGINCGIFGGTNPYVLSGLPTVPAIWMLNISGINVTVKAKSH